MKKEKITVEMAEDIGLIPNIRPFFDGRFL